MKIAALAPSMSRQRSFLAVLGISLLAHAIVFVIALVSFAPYARFVR